MQVCCWQATGVVHGRFETSPSSHHTAVGRLLPGQVTARAADAGSAHCSESRLSSLEPDKARLAACRLRHSAPSWGAQPLAQGTASPP